MPVWMRRVLWGCVLVVFLSGLPLVLHFAGFLPPPPEGARPVCSLPMPKPLGHIPPPSSPHPRQMAVSQR